MQLINVLPTPEQLALPLEIAKRVVELLIEPFGTIESAQAYWQENTTHFVILTPTDTDASLKSLSDLTQSLVIAADDNPEFVEKILETQSQEQYQLSLIIYTDVGNGLYLVKPVDMELSALSIEVNQ
ncbi:MAG: hypothetical protein OCD00_06605 [Colwellia sp.]